MSDEMPERPRRPNWRDDCEVLGYDEFVTQVRPTPEHDWAEAWAATIDGTLPEDHELANWCCDQVSRTGVQYEPIVVRDGVVVRGLEQALAWYQFGDKWRRDKRIYVMRESAES